jgi:hypothetical protein
MKGILTTIKQAWTKFINELGLGDQPRMWTFVKSIVGKGSPQSPDDRSIKINGVTTNDPSEKAQAFLDQFSAVHLTDIPYNLRYEETTAKHAELTKYPQRPNNIKRNEKGLTLVEKQCSRNGPGTQLSAKKHLTNQEEISPAPA